MASSISGLGSVIEFAPEVTYGTGVAKTVSVPFVSEGITRTVGVSKSNAIRYNNSLGVDSDTILTHQEVGGDLVFPLWDKGLELLFESVYEDYTFAAATPNTHTFLIGAQGATHPSVCADIFMGGTTAQEAKNITGMIVNGYTVSGSTEASEPIQISFDTICKDLTFNDSDTAVGVEVASLEAFTWAGVDIALGGSTPPDPCLRSFELSVNIPKERRWCLGSTTTDKPDRSGMAEITGSLGFYFEDWDEADALVAGTMQSLVITIGEISASTNHQYEWTNQIRFTDGHANVNGHDRIEVDVNFEVLSTTANDQDASGHQLVISNTQPTL